MPHPGEAAEERLREYWPQRGNGDKEGVSQFKEHDYYLAPLVPPASFMPDLTSSEGLWLSRRGVRSVMHSVGRLLGGADELTERRRCARRKRRQGRWGRQGGRGGGGGCMSTLVYVA